LIGLFVSTTASPVLPVAGSGIVGSRADRLLKQMAEMKLAHAQQRRNPSLMS